jgi:hypothetical protein
MGLSEPSVADDLTRILIASGVLTPDTAQAPDVVAAIDALARAADVRPNDHVPARGPKLNPAIEHVVAARGRRGDPPDGSTSIIRKKEVRRRTGLSDPTIWRMEHRGEFPQRVHWVHDRVRAFGKRPVRAGPD